MRLKSPNPLISNLLMSHIFAWLSKYQILLFYGNSLKKCVAKNAI
jgi:hypothetical protein